MRSLLLVLALASVASAEPIVVGVKSAPPFSMQEDGEWVGISVAASELIAARMGEDVEFRSYDAVNGLLEAVATGEVDVAAGAITINSEREGYIDFTHAFHSTGIVLAVHKDAHTSMAYRVKTMLPKLWSLALLILVIPVIFGVLMYFLERGRNEQFRTVFDGVWWAIVSFSTVGYGDKVPIKNASRIIAIVWIYWGITIFGTIAGAAASVFSETNLVNLTIEDFHQEDTTLATVGGTTSAEFLESKGIRYQSYATIREALQAVANTEVTGLVYDEPVIAYYQRAHHFPVRILPGYLKQEAYGFALPTGSPLREPWNRALLHITERPSWGVLMEQYRKGNEG